MALWKEFFMKELGKGVSIYAMQYVYLFSEAQATDFIHL